MSRIGWYDQFSQDLRYALRTAGKNPVLALTAIAVLALAIGANATIFTVVNAVLLKPLGYHEPDRLVSVTGGATVARFEAIQQAQSLSVVGSYSVFNDTVTISNDEGAEALKGVRVTANFLSILGVAPLQGRSFLSEEQRAGTPVAMISASLWQRRFGSDARTAGSVVRIGGAPCTIVGVLPQGFAFPSADVDVWRPWQPDLIPMPGRLHSPLLSVFGRLKPDVSAIQAGAEIALINRQYAQSHPGMLDAKTDRPETIKLFQDALVKDVRSMLWMLFGAVGFVLLIACANVASLLLARAASRSREFAIRAAIGASRPRLIAQMLMESLLLAVAGGVLGLLAAKLGLRGIALMPGLDLPRSGEIQLDGRVLAFTIALSGLASLLFGLAPSLSASRPDLSTVMKDSGETAVMGWTRRISLWLSPRSLLVVGQVALSIVLLIGAALLLETLAHLRQVDPGFQAANVLTMQISLPQSRFEELVERVQSISGVKSAAVTVTLPMTGFAGTPVHIVGRPVMPLNQRPIAVLQNVTPGYFRTLGIALERGRDFTRQDSATSPYVVVINESIARKFWPSYPQGPDPIGHFLLAGANPEPLKIVGVVRSVHQAGLADDVDLGIYRPRSQTVPMPAMFAVRTEGEPRRFLNAIRHEVAAIDRDQAVTSVRTMEEVVEASEGKRRSLVVLLSAFAAMGLLLAIVGIYGVMAYLAMRRTREVGIRRALGAQQSDILTLVLSESLRLALAGAALGLLGAAALTRVLKDLLYGVGATDPSTFAGVTALMILTALAAAYLPARRAAKADPSEGLRTG